MSRTFSIVNWDSYQHYKDRNPPWIKLHRELLSSRTWVALDDASRVLAVACMLIAAATGNQIPDDPDYIRRVAYLNSKPNFTPLIKVGFLEIQSVEAEEINFASVLQADARPETETEAEAEKRQKTRVGLAELSVVHIEQWLAEKRDGGKYIQYDPDFVLEQFKQFCLSTGKTYKDYVMAYRNAFEWDSMRKRYAEVGAVRRQEVRSNRIVV